MRAFVLDGHHQRKRFGQHFLVDDYAIDAILACVAAGPQDHVLEIGPGAGALTQPLLASGATLDVVEIDRDLAASLAVELAGNARLTVHQADILAFDFAVLAARAPHWIAVGNLPYNISTPLILRLLEHGALWSRLVLMVQREVAERLAAGPGSRAYGRLSIAAQRRCAIVQRFSLGPDSFDPPPKVDSTVIELIPSGVCLDPAFERWLGEVVRVAFSARRKTVANALRGYADAACLVASGIDPAVRPENIEVSAWVQLAANCRK